MHEEDIAKWLEDAQKKREEEDLLGAEQLYERILKGVPDHQEALLRLGILYVSTGRGPLALKKLQEAQKSNPESPGPYRAIGTIIRISGHLGLGERFFKTKMESAGAAQPYVILSLAEIYAAMGEIDNLTEQLSFLLEHPTIEPLAQSILWMETGTNEGLLSLSKKLSGSLQKTVEGMAAEIKSQWEDASKLYFEASRMENPTWYSLSALGALWLSAGNAEYCEKYLSYAEEEAPNASEIQLTKARLLAAQGFKEDARLLLQRICESPGNFMRTKHIAKSLLGQISPSP